MNSDIRDAWVIKTLSEMPAGLRILDAGAGCKRYELYCKHLDYVSQDFCKYDGKGDGAGLQRGVKEAVDIDIVSNIVNISESNNSFDVILCTEVLEHIPNPIAAIKEFSRLLKPDGKLILTTPFCSLAHYTPYHFYSGFSKYFYEKFLLENGFEIISLEANGSFFEYLMQELSRIEKMVTKYTDTQLTFAERTAIEHVYRGLQRIHVCDKNSFELLCFGYHVLAKKL